jgi:general secretion pathway protein G
MTEVTMRTPLLHPWRRGRRRGFTIVELIVVMTIMTVLGLFAAMAINNVQDNVKIKETKATIKMMEQALYQYKQDMGFYPLGDQASIVTTLSSPNSGWKDAGMHWFPSRKEVKDAWALPLYYVCHEDYVLSERGVELVPTKGLYYNSETYQIYSMGPNMKTWPISEGASKSRLCGTEPDDIRNWKHETFCTPADYGEVEE